MPIKIIRVPKAKPVEAATRLEPTADKHGALVWAGDRYLGRILQGAIGWLAYPPRYLVESLNTKDDAIAYLVKYKDKA